MHLHVSEHRLIHRTAKDILAPGYGVLPGITPVVPKIIPQTTTTAPLTSNNNYFGNNVPTNTLNPNYLPVGTASPTTPQGYSTGLGQSDATIQQRDINQQNADAANADLARQGFTGSNLLYDSSLTPAQNATNERASQMAGKYPLTIQQAVDKATSDVNERYRLITASGASYDPEQKARDIAAAQASAAGIAMKVEEGKKLALQNLQTQAASSAAGASAANPASQTGQAPNTQVGTSTVPNRLPSSVIPTGQARQDRQSFIEQKRLEGFSDQQIRDMINTLPPEQTGGASAPTAPAVAPQPTQSTPSAPATSETKNTPSAPSGAPVVNPQTTVGTNLLRNLAATETDPITKALMLANADYIDANPMPDDPMSQSQFMTGADGRAISSPYDAIQQILDKATTRADESKDSRQSFLQGQLDRTNSYNAAQEANIKAKLQFDNDKAVRAQTDANKKLLDSKTIMLALSGGFGSADGNSEIAEARLKGEQAIADLTKETGFKMADVSLFFTDAHNKAFDKYQTDWLTALDNFETTVSNIDLQGISNQQAKRNALGTAYKDYVSEIKTARTAHATAIKDATKSVYDVMNTQKDAKRAQEQLGWQRLQSAVNTYGSMIPQGLLDSIQNQLPGVDLSDIKNSQTLTEANQNFDNITARMKKGGGSVGGVSASYTYDPASVSPQAQAFSNVSTSQLRAAVDRLFAPANYGGTAGERAERKQDYLRRINSGENPGSIISDMQGDYWASQKGAPRNAHDGRTEAQASADSLQSYIDFYSIGGDNDGPLGQIDSRVEGFKSIFGMSSQEYNNLANNVGNIRARIIKENYGAAVTTQELDLAKSYIPDMTDKGNVFVTKLQNLKNYNAYLDAKVFADNMQLPAPVEPEPVTLTGNSMAGPGKYSNNDLTSALTE